MGIDASTLARVNADARGLVTFVTESLWPMTVWRKIEKLKQRSPSCSQAEASPSTKLVISASWLYLQLPCLLPELFTSSLLE